MDLQYHDLRPDSSLSRRVGLRSVVTQEEVERAVTEPPDDTRAFFRGACLAKFSHDIVAANWDSIVFDTGESALHRVPMLEPSRGTRAHVGELIDRSATAQELIELLGR